MDSVTTIDTNYLGHPQFAAAYLMVENDRAAFVDNNTNGSVPLLLDALRASGVKPANVDYLFVTHIHLDHAGGTSALSQACPNAQIVAHPRAAPHLIDPTRLVASASAVYGEERFRELYGELAPIAESRVQTVEDGETMTWGNRKLSFLHTRGHANHHYCLVDPAAECVFTGDAFGLVYPLLQAQGLFAMPSTSPTDFDGPLARESVERIVATGMRRVFPTHYGEVTQIEDAADQLIRHLEFSERVMLDAEASELPDDALTDYVRGRIDDYFVGRLDQHGSLAHDPAIRRLLELDLDLNAQGLAFVAAKRRRKAREQRA